jgi:hypothetical protein
MRRARVSPTPYIYSIYPVAGCFFAFGPIDALRKFEVEFRLAAEIFGIDKL